VVRITKRRQQKANLFKREFPAWLTGASEELGDHGIELFDCSRVGHRDLSIKAAPRINGQTASPISS
jgi:hypothetical protein